MQLNLEQKALLALFRCHCHTGEGNAPTDCVVAGEGVSLFGPGWLSHRWPSREGKRHRTYAYYPQLNLALGRLARRGLCRKLEGRKVQYLALPFKGSGWELSQEGQLAAASLKQALATTPPSPGRLRQVAPVACS